MIKYIITGNTAVAFMLLSFVSSAGEATMQWSGEASAEADADGIQHHGDVSAEKSSDGAAQLRDAPTSAEPDDAPQHREAPAETDVDEVNKRGVYIGLDPGTAVRFDDGEIPIYARLEFRVGGCFSPRLHLGMDWRTDIFTANAEDAAHSRHSIGPVLTAFLIKGWFLRPYIHVGGFRSVSALIGAQTGYEFGWGKLGAIGFAVSGDTDIPFSGPPLGYTTSVVMYFTAYDIQSRRDRD